MARPLIVDDQTTPTKLREAGIDGADIPIDGMNLAWNKVTDKPTKFPVALSQNSTLVGQFDSVKFVNGTNTVVGVTGNGDGTATVKVDSSATGSSGTRVLHSAVEVNNSTTNNITFNTDLYDFCVRFVGVFNSGFLTLPSASAAFVGKQIILFIKVQSGVCGVTYSSGTLNIDAGSVATLIFLCGCESTTMGSCSYTWVLVYDSRGTIADNAITTAKIADDSVTFAKLQNSTGASKVVGRGSTGGAGDYGELAPGNGIGISGSNLIADINGTSAGTAIDTNADKLLMYDASAGVNVSILLKHAMKEVVVTSATTFDCNNGFWHEVVAGSSFTPTIVNHVTGKILVARVAATSNITVSFPSGHYAPSASISLSSGQRVLLLCLYNGTSYHWMTSGILSQV